MKFDITSAACCQELLDAIADEVSLTAQIPALNRKTMLLEVTQCINNYYMRNIFFLARSLLTRHLLPHRAVFTNHRNNAPSFAPSLARSL